MQVRHGDGDMVFLTTMVNKKPSMLDHEVLGTSLKLSTSQLKLANIDISKDFIFNKNELRLYLSVMCGHKVLPDICVKDGKILFEHFTPVFQTLALIIRSNIYPNISDNKLVSFAEAKLMYKLAGHKVHFNLSNMILLQMINGFKKGHMLYGLLLKKIFEHFRLNVNTLPYFPVEATISDRAKRVVVPLPGLPHVINLDPTPSPVSVVPNQQEISDSKFAFLQAENDKLVESLKTLQEDFKPLVAKVDLTEARVGILVNILSGTMSRASRIEKGLN
ncbi:hypothetical protein AgCh_010292 [Apium graveolens]